MQLKEFIKNDRMDKGLKQEEYAKLIGIGRTTLTHIENGRIPSVDTINKLVNHFGKPVSELLGEEKVQKMSELETTNMLIDKLINMGEITENKITDEAKKMLWTSLELEIKLKLKMREN